MELDTADIVEESGNGTHEKTQEELRAEFLREQLREYIFYKDVRHTIPETANEYCKKTSYNPHILPLSILVLLFCLYFGLSYVHDSYMAETSTSSSVPVNEEPIEYLNETLIAEKKAQEEQLRQEVILNKLLEHEDVCYDMAIFTEHYPAFIPPENFEDDSLQLDSDEASVELSKQSLYNEHYTKGNGQNSGKEAVDKTSKSNSKAEPIIYILALAFICLLIRAFSDINDHYKAKKKNYRTRRYSLQSYAQAHKQDRRSSKDNQKNHHQKQQCLDKHSMSVDQFGNKLTKEQLKRKSELLKDLRKYASFEEQKNINNSLESINIQNQLLDFEELKTKEHLGHRAPGTSTSSSSSSRRCSLNIHRADVVSRRRSIASGIGATMGVSINSLGIGIEPSNDTEPKKRVRMLNRH